MNKEKVIKLIDKVESHMVEWRLSLSSVNEIIEAVSAFANTEGGRVIGGILSTGAPNICFSHSNYRLYPTSI